MLVPGALSLDEISLVGVSFYPFYNSGATLAALKSSLTALANQLKKPLIVAETDWPVACSGRSLTQPSIPVSAAGQETWIKNIKSVLESVPNGLGQGICESLVPPYIQYAPREANDTLSVYWEPSWIGNANLGSGCSVSTATLPPSFVLAQPSTGVQDNLLVDSSGRTRSSINVFNDM